MLTLSSGAAEGASPALLRAAENFIAVVGSVGFGVSLYLIHIYVTPLKRFLQLLWGFGSVSALALMATQVHASLHASLLPPGAAADDAHIKTPYDCHFYPGAMSASDKRCRRACRKHACMAHAACRHVVLTGAVHLHVQPESITEYVSTHPGTVWAVGPFFAAVTGVAFKEGVCYGKPECAALFFITPALLLGERHSSYPGQSLHGCHDPLTEAGKSMIIMRVAGRCCRAPEWDPPRAC